MKKSGAQLSGDSGEIRTNKIIQAWGTRHFARSYRKRHKPLILRINIALEGLAANTRWGYEDNVAHFWCELNALMEELTESRTAEFWEHTNDV